VRVFLLCCGSETLRVEVGMLNEVVEGMVQFAMRSTAQCWTHGRKGLLKCLSFCDLFGCEFCKNRQRLLIQSFGETINKTTSFKTFTKAVDFM